MSGDQKYGSYVIRSYRSRCDSFLSFSFDLSFSITFRYLLTLLVTHTYFTIKHWLLSLTSHRFIMLIDGSETCRKWYIRYLVGTHLPCKNIS
jgi:hypothetical protein